MAERLLPSIDVLRQLLRYEPETGKLFWRPRGEEWFRTRVAMKIFDANFAGREAGGLDKDGYIRIKLFQTRLVAHRVVWAVYHGSWPVGVLDHIDGNRTNNRVENLRDVTNAENLRNRHSSRSSTGIRGVYPYGKSGKYVAYIGVAGGNRRLGCFGNIEDAVAARHAAELVYGYRQN